MSYQHQLRHISIFAQPPTLVLEPQLTRTTLHSDEDYADTQSELNCLRTAMKAIEIQALDHIQRNEDDELTESIKSWKAQWVELDYRTKENKKRCRSDGSSSPESV